MQQAFAPQQPVFFSVFEFLYDHLHQPIHLFAAFCIDRDDFFVIQCFECVTVRLVNKIGSKPKAKPLAFAVVIVGGFVDIACVYKCRVVGRDLDELVIDPVFYFAFQQNIKLVELVCVFFDCVKLGAGSGSDLSGKTSFAYDIISFRKSRLPVVVTASLP